MHAPKIWGVIFLQKKEKINLKDELAVSDTLSKSCSVFMTTVYPEQTCIHVIH